MRSVPPPGRAHRLSQPALLGGAELLDESDGGPSIGADFVETGLLPVQLLDHDERQDHIVFVESEWGLGVGEQDAGVEYEGVGHLFGLLGGRRQGA